MVWFAGRSGLEVIDGGDDIGGEWQPPIDDGILTGGIVATGILYPNVHSSETHPVKLILSLTDSYWSLLFL